jgi:hypothetical protein
MILPVRSLTDGLRILDGSVRPAGRSSIGGFGRIRAPSGALGESAAPAAPRDDGEVKTRTLIILAIVTGTAILAAGITQILMAR